MVSDAVKWREWNYLLKTTRRDNADHFVEGIQDLECMCSVLRNCAVISGCELSSLKMPHQYGTVEAVFTICSVTHLTVTVLLRPELEPPSQAEEVLVMNLMLLQVTCCQR